jgi:hypothetical protein
MEGAMAVGRQRYREGAVFEVDLGDGTVGFGRLMREPDAQFFDLRVKRGEVVTAEQVVGRKVLFQVAVARSEITSGRWPVIGVVPLTEEEQTAVIRNFKQHPITGALEIYEAGPGRGEWREYPAEWEDCVGLERASVWEGPHVASRLLDHFEGRENQWVRSERLRRPGEPLI